MARVVDRAHLLGIHAIVTVFSVELVSAADPLAWDSYKTASPDVVNRPLIDAILATGRPLILSTGAASLDEVHRAASWIGNAGARERTAALQCVSSYPTPQEDAQLGAIEVIQKATGLTTGYSDHTREIGTGALAVAAGACILEKHLTHSRAADGPAGKAASAWCSRSSVVRSCCDCRSICREISCRVAWICRRSTHSSGVSIG